MFTFHGSVIVEIRGGRRVVFAPLGPRALRLFAAWTRNENPSPMTNKVPV